MKENCAGNSANSNLNHGNSIQPISHELQTKKGGAQTVDGQGKM